MHLMKFDNEDGARVPPPFCARPNSVMMERVVVRSFHVEGLRSSAISTGAPVLSGTLQENRQGANCRQARVELRASVMLRLR